MLDAGVKPDNDRINLFRLLTPCALGTGFFTNIPVHHKDAEEVSMLFCILKTGAIIPYYQRPSSLVARINNPATATLFTTRGLTRFAIWGAIKPPIIAAGNIMAKRSTSKFPNW